jgi:alkanesulfonate monooxygenase SsuD/methylene tetrahydromethanopterin reductase-like flavin-dependent oxidoreductase (luciferase family)
MVKIIMLFDMRSPDIGPPTSVVYKEALDMARFADAKGFDYIHVSEHHGSEDNYLPAPFVAAGAMAGITSRIRIALNALVLPLHDPVEVAEQIAVLDHISQGRLEVVFGAGYVPGEFARAGVPLSERGRLLDEGLEIIVRALAGERFQARGREVFVRPVSRQRPHPPFILGGGVPAAARRAAKFGFGFAPMKPGLFSVYEEECKKLGRAPGTMLGLQGPIAVHVTEDPEKAWDKLMPHLVHVARTYSQWAADAGDETSTYKGLMDPKVIRESGKYAVVTPEQCIALAASQEELHSSLVFQPQIGGLDPAEAWKSLNLFADKVLPQLRK